MVPGPVKYISAGDLEKFSYCPLSWLLSIESDGETEDTRSGIVGHEKIGRSLWKIDATEKTAREAEKLVFWWAIVATVIAIMGLELLPFENSVTISQVLGVVALIWILAALFFLYKASKSTIDSNTVEYEKIILAFAVVAVLVAVNAVAFLFANVRIADALETVAIIWLVGASFYLYRSLRSTEIVEGMRKEFRVRGKIEYIDMDKSKTFRSERYGLSGRPDYVIRMKDNLIPVEEKTGRTPRGPLFSHILQVAAYCLLIEETSGKAPPYGLLKYPEHEHEIEYNEDLKKVLLQKLDEMRLIMGTKEAHRNHDRPGKCISCSRRHVCPERLA
jgi:CRISPR-associated exonuclease Cas4